MNLPLCIVLLYVVLLFAVSFYVSHKQRNNKESLLLYKGQNNTLIVAASVAGLAIGGASTRRCDCRTVCGRQAPPGQL